MEVGSDWSMLFGCQVSEFPRPELRCSRPNTSRYRIRCTNNRASLDRLSHEPDKATRVCFPGWLLFCARGRAHQKGDRADKTSAMCYTYVCPSLQLIEPFWEALREPTAAPLEKGISVRCLRTCPGTKACVKSRKSPLPNVLRQTS